MVTSELKPLNVVTSSPAMIAGDDDFERRSASSAICSALAGPGVRVPWFEVARIWVSFDITSTGRLMKTGPRGGVMAILNALANMGPISSAVLGSADHLTTGLAISTRS